jgi:phosphohistidine swiveling domain-containing protein
VSVVEGAGRDAWIPAWTLPSDAERTWKRDRMHFPEPITVLDAEMVEIASVHGLNHGAEHYGFPFRNHMRRFWSRHYESGEPLAISAEERDARRQRSRAAFGAVFADYDGRWTSLWEPEIAHHLRFWADFDLEAATKTALQEHLGETMRRLHRIWELHFEIVLTVGTARANYLELHAELFEGASKLQAMALVQGVDNLTTTAGRRLWLLRDAATATPAVGEALLRHEPGDALTALAGLPEAAAFLDALAAYLEEFGHRSTHIGVSSPTLLEDPTPVIKMLQDALARPEHDVERQHAQLVEERERLVAEARAAIAHYPAPVRAEFDVRLALAHTAQRVDEDHNFLIDFASMAAARRVFLAFGRRFAAAGVLERPDDVVHLTSSEMAETAAALPNLDRRALVAARRAEIERDALTEPPSTVGAPADPTAPAGNDFTGTPPPPAPSADVLPGTPGSSGVARGLARVVRTLDDAILLRPGEILVAPTTSQPWMTLFSTAAALVTDTGGVLSHTAVVAREYGLPAVVGTVHATTVLRDGMLLEVDGDRGLVRIVAES